MAEAGLMISTCKTIVGRPSVMVKEPFVALSQDRSCLGKPSPGKNCVDRDVFADDYPEPFQVSRHPPAGFIQPIDEASADRSDQLLIGWVCFFAQAGHGPAQSAATGSQSVSQFEHPRDALVRDTHLFVQMGGQRQGLGTELHLGRTQSIGSLKRMSTLHVSSATGAPTDLDVESPGDRPPHNVLLKLRLGLPVNDRASTARTFVRQWDADLLVNSRRNGPRGSLAVVIPWLAARRLGIGFGITFGEWRGLPLER